MEDILGCTTLGAVIAAWLVTLVEDSYGQEKAWAYFSNVHFVLFFKKASRWQSIAAGLPVQLQVDMTGQPS